MEGEAADDASKKFLTSSVAYKIFLIFLSAPLSPLSIHTPFRNPSVEYRNYLFSHFPEITPIYLTKMSSSRLFSCLLVLVVACMTITCNGFSVLPPPVLSSQRVATSFVNPQSISSTQLYMSDQERSRKSKKGVQTITIDKTETKAEEDKKKEEMWRVVLHNDEVHTFNYVIRSLCKCVGILDRKAAFEICVQTHGIGKATVTKTWKKQAEQFCLGLQRQGLTVSISPDEDFDGGHSGGGL